MRIPKTITVNHKRYRLLTKKIQLAGSITVAVYSVDGVRWDSDYRILKKSMERIENVIREGTLYASGSSTSDINARFFTGKLWRSARRKGNL